MANLVVPAIAGAGAAALEKHIGKAMDTAEDIVVSAASSLLGGGGGAASGGAGSSIRRGQPRMRPRKSSLAAHNRGDVSAYVEANDHDGGEYPSKSRVGGVKGLRFSRPGKRRLSTAQKAHAAYAMAKDFMPRLKVRSFNIFDSYDEWSDISCNYTDTASVATNFRDWDDLGGNRARNRFVQSGLMLLRDMDAASYERCIEGAVFPLGHVNVLRRGPGPDERLQDFVSIKAIHLQGFVECATIRAPHAASIAFGNSPSGMAPSFTRTRKIRMMIVRVLDDPAPTINYAGEVWPNVPWPLTGRTAENGAMITSCPALRSILDATFTSYPDDSVRGAWNKIDRKYLRKHNANKNLWDDDSQKVRPFDFTVMKDLTFTVGEAASLRPWGTGGNHGAGHKNRIYIDEMIKLNLDLSYPEAAPHVDPLLADGSDQAVDRKDVLANCTNPVFIYLFDDSIEGWLNGTTDAGEAPVPDNDMHQSYSVSGYVRSRAKLTADIYFTDDL